VGVRGNAPHGRPGGQIILATPVELSQLPRSHTVAGKGHGKKNPLRSLDVRSLDEPLAGKDQPKLLGRLS
jgi:hypothetical protein